MKNRLFVLSECPFKEAADLGYPIEEIQEKPNESAAIADSVIIEESDEINTIYVAELVNIAKYVRPKSPKWIKV